MTPDELLWDGALWNLAKLAQVGALLQVDIHAVSEADFLLSNQHLSLNSKWKHDFVTAFLETCQSCLPGLLSELHR